MFDWVELWGVRREKEHCVMSFAGKEMQLLFTIYGEKRHYP